MTWSYVFYGYVFLPLVLLAYAAFGVWLLWRVATLTTTARWIRVGLSAAIVAVFLLIPAGDVIVGRSQFAHLCETEAGVKVHRQVVLEKSHRRPDGSLNLTFTPGRIGYQIGDAYEMRFSEEQVSSWPRITRVISEVRDVKRNEVLGRQLNFLYWGGWLARQMPGHLVAANCPLSRDPKASLEHAVFQTN